MGDPAGERKSRSLPTRTEPSLSSLGMTLFACLLCFVGDQLPGVAQEQVGRPKITGIAYVRVYAADLNRSRAFYGKILGLTSGGGGCINISRPCYTVNSHH